MSRVKQREKGGHMQQILNTKLNTEDNKSRACEKSGMKTEKKFQSMVTQPNSGKKVERILMKR